VIAKSTVIKGRGGKSGRRAVKAVGLIIVCTIWDPVDGIFIADYEQGDIGEVPWPYPVEGAFFSFVGLHWLDCP
jgi:hypothetical protein